ncbi:MAG: radical SAM protein [Deltaproteobacteria bacterium]|nr:radical SAM protein [Deltaproteobacteria bacterium]
MKNDDLKNLPHLLFADPDGRIYDHPSLRMVGFSGHRPVVLEKSDLIPLSEFGKLFFLPDCPPIGLDPATGAFKTLSEWIIGGVTIQCCAVAAFLEPGLVRSHLPAADYSSKSYVLPSWAYTAVGMKKEQYLAAGFRIEYNHKWDPQHYDDRELTPAIAAFQRQRPGGPLLEHLKNCAAGNHCFAAKNLFLKRWEAPLPVSRECNALCLGCLSLQPDRSCEASHERISFTPSAEEIVALAVKHLNQAPEAIVSFGQGCEGEPLTEHQLIAHSIKEIRRQTGRGTINLNTNGSRPGRVRRIIESGLDSIRISLNSARPELYRAYFRPKNYDFKDVVASISLARDMGMYTMINYLVFPGVTDQEEEIDALCDLIGKTGVNFVHFKNLCIDPQLYLAHMPEASSAGMGMKEMVGFLKREFPDREFGYFNKAVR